MKLNNIFSPVFLVSFLNKPIHIKHMWYQYITLINVYMLIIIYTLFTYIWSIDDILFIKNIDFFITLINLGYIDWCVAWRRWNCFFRPKMPLKLKLFIEVCFIETEKYCPIRTWFQIRFGIFWNKIETLKGKLKDRSFSMKISFYTLK